jgi:capsid assembly protease
MSNYPHIAARIFNKPLALEAGYAEVFCAALADRLKIKEIENGASTKLAADIGLDRTAAKKHYSVTGGVAQIPVNGTLVHKSGYIGSQSGIMGYDGLNYLIDSANSDPEVRAILLDVDSPGGEVSGVETTVQKVKSSIKPVYAHANETAASAAYWIASSAKQLYLSNTASVGSVGVITVHADYSKQLDEEGVKVTIIKAGQHKADGNPYEELPDEVQARIQSEVDSLRTEFASSVASGRKMSVDQVLATEALMYRGQSAVDSKLADGVKSYEDTLKMVINSVSLETLNRPKGQQRPQGQKGNAMNNGENAHASGQGEEVNLEAALRDARAQAATAERTRIAAIMANGNSDTARHLAFNTDISPEAAAEILKTIPQATASDAKAKALADMQSVQAVEPSESKRASTTSKLDMAMQAATNKLGAK